MQDVHVALLDLKEESASGKHTPPTTAGPAGPRSRTWMYAAGAVLAIGVVTAVMPKGTIGGSAVGAGQPKTIGTISPPPVGGLSVSSDLKHLLYARCDQCAADLMLVENFR